MRIEPTVTNEAASAEFRKSNCQFMPWREQAEGPEGFNKSKQLMKSSRCSPKARYGIG
jgi:hypothetical protein